MVILRLERLTSFVLSQSKYSRTLHPRSALILSTDFGFRTLSQTSPSFAVTGNGKRKRRLRAHTLASSFWHARKDSKWVDDANHPKRYSVI